MAMYPIAPHLRTIYEDRGVFTTTHHIPHTRHVSTCWLCLYGRRIAMADMSKARSSSIDLGATVVVKRDGELLGQRGSVVDKKQGWYKVQLPGVDGIKSFRWAEIKEMEAPPPSPPPSANPSPIKPQAPSPSKKISSESTAAAAAVVGVAGDKSSSRGKAAGGLPPRHPSAASAASAADEKTVTMRRRITRGRPSENDAGVTPNSSAAGALDQPDQEREDEEEEEEKARGGSAGRTADVYDDEETESEANREVDEDETDLDDVEEGGGGGADTDVDEGH
ncbi:unnamed protein product, partial [Ectocarpus sp. 13 AM-2016]